MKRSHRISALDQGAVGVRYVRTAFLPEDETVLHLFEAPSPEALDCAGKLAELSFERIVEAFEGSAGRRRPSTI